MDKHSDTAMVYNTQHNKLKFKEYGRNVQRLVEHLVHIEDAKLRNSVSRSIVNLMGQMHPHLRNIEEFRHKLWDQLHTIAEFNLEIDGPYPKPTPEEVVNKPGFVPYPQDKIRFKHYGRNVEVMIEKAVAMEDGQKRNEFTMVIAGYMKMVYRNWNQDNVSDETIINDLSTLSKGVLKVGEDALLEQPKSHRKRKRVGSSDRDRDRSSRNNSSYKRSHRR